MAYATKLYSNRSYVGVALFCATIFSMAVMHTQHQARRRLPAYEHDLVGNLMVCDEAGLTRTNGALLGQPAPNGEYASYFEPQNNGKCPLHTVRSIMSSAGVALADLPSIQDMNKAADAAAADFFAQHPEFGMLPKDIVVMTRGMYGHDKLWEDHAVERMLQQHGFTWSRNNTSQSADAWIAFNGGHWYAYIQTSDGDWFNVDSIFQWKRKFEATHNPGYNQGPQYVGDAAAMLNQIRQDLQKYKKRNGSIYAVTFPVQQMHAAAAAPATSQAKDDQECKSAGPSGSDTDSAMGDDVMGNDASASDTELNGTPQLPAQTVAVPEVAPPAIPQPHADHTPAVETWACSKCTYANEPYRSRCEMCNGVRPKPQAPATGWVCPGCHKVRTQAFCGPCANTTCRIYSRPA